MKTRRAECHPHKPLTARARCLARGDSDPPRFRWSSTTPNSGKERNSPPQAKKPWQNRLNDWDHPSPRWIFGNSAHENSAPWHLRANKFRERFRAGDSRRSREGFVAPRFAEPSHNSGLLLWYNPAISTQAPPWRCFRRRWKIQTNTFRYFSAFRHKLTYLEMKEGKKKSVLMHFFPPQQKWWPFSPFKKGAGGRCNVDIKIPGNEASTVSTMPWTGPSWPEFNGIKSLLTEITESSETSTKKNQRTLRKKKSENLWINKLWIYK